MSNIVFVGVLALLIIFAIHVALKLYLFEDDNVNVENLKFNNDNLNNNNNNNRNNNDVTSKNLWNELTNQPVHSHTPASYGPAPAKTEHAYQGKRGTFNGVVPNYPVLATENEFQVTDAEMDTGQRLTQVGDMTVGTNTAFDL